MRALTASICVLLLVACGGGKKDKKTDAKGDTKTPTNETTTPKEEPKVALTKEQMLQKLWADPKNDDTTKSLLSFSADGKFTYAVFNGKEWKEFPSTYKTEGDKFTDLGDGNAYNMTISETKLTLDNPTPEKQDFTDWIPATAKDCDGAATPPCPLAPKAEAPK
jgi:hypothetical protein